MQPQTVKEMVFSELVERGSRFLSYLIPYDLFSFTMSELRKENPKASHFVYAYRFINEQNQIVENLSDDGEPKGSSGRPTLMILNSLHLVNVALITVRYFGGTKLGVGGLMRAYSESAQQVIGKSHLLPYHKKLEVICSIPYSLQNKFQYILGQFHGSLVKRSPMIDLVEITFNLDENEVFDFKKTLEKENIVTTLKYK